MAEGTSSYRGLAVPLNGQSEIKQINVSYDLLTLTGAASNTSNLLVIQNSAGTEMLRFLPYGRLRIIRTDTEQQHTYINTLDVKMDLDYAAGAAQCYAGTFILDTAGGTTDGGREAVLHLQYYGGTQVTNGMAYSFINFSDQGDTDVGALFVVLGQTPDSGMFQTVSNPNSTHGFVIYVNNVKYWLLCADSSA